MKYQVVIYDYDSNTILIKPMKSQSGPEMTRAYKVIHADLMASRFKPKSKIWTMKPQTYSGTSWHPTTSIIIPHPLEPIAAMLLNRKFEFGKTISLQPSAASIPLSHWIFGINFSQKPSLIWTCSEYPGPNHACPHMQKFIVHLISTEPPLPPLESTLSFMNY